MFNNLFLDTLYTCFLCLSSFYSLDILVLKKLNKDNNTRWYLLHGITNTIASLFSYNDMIFTLTNPLDISRQISLFPTNIILALHIYHILIFKLTLIDWIHHILMIGIAVPMAIIYNNTGTIINYCCFFLSGFPGAIDYYMLFFVKKKIISRITEKKINSYINLWIRGPFLVIGSYITYLNIYFNNFPMPILIVCVLLFWNAQYFTKRIVGNYYVNN